MKKKVITIKQSHNPHDNMPTFYPRRSQSTVSLPTAQIELIQNENNLFSTQSTFFKTFTEMASVAQFNKTISRIPSPKTRIQIQLKHNKNQSEAILTYSRAKVREAITGAAYNNRYTPIKTTQKLKRRDLSPVKAIELKPEHRAYQLPKLENGSEKKITIPPQLTFYMEHQKLTIDVKTFKPSFVECATLLYYNDFLYLYGGIGGDGIRNQMMRYELKQQTWQLLDCYGDMPTKGRSALTVVPFKNKFVYFGGGGMYNTKMKQRECYNTLYEFNVLQHQWEKIYPQGDYIEPRRHHKACLYGNKWMLVYGGINANEEVLGDTFMYHIERQLWKALSQTTEPICCHAIVNVSTPIKSIETDSLPMESVYCFGGKDKDGNSTKILRKLNYCQQLNTPTGWDIVEANGKYPHPCHNHTLEYLKKIQGIVLLGGLRDVRINGTLESGDIYVYYPSMNMWQQVVPAGSYGPRCAHCSVVLSQKIAIFGGIGNDRYLEPDVAILDTDQSQVQAKALKYQQMEMQRQEKLERQFTEPIKKRKTQPFSFSNEYNLKGFKITLRKALQDRRSFLPQPNKKQILIRYDLLIGFVKKVIIDNISTLQNFEQYLQKQQ